MSRTDRHPGNKPKAPPPQIEPPDVEEPPVLDQDAMADIDEVFAACDEAVQEGYDNSAAQGGMGWTPPAGRYEFMLVNDEQTGKCGQMRIKHPPEDMPDKLPYPILDLFVEIVTAPNEEDVGKRFTWTMFLAPFIDKQTKQTRVVNGDIIKKMCQDAFDQEVTPLRDACRRILEECGGLAWAARVTYKRDSDFPNYRLGDPVQSG
jgi:hypothetical protein